MFETKSMIFQNRPVSISRGR